MVNNCRMDRAKVGRLQGPIVGYAEDSTLVYYSAPYDSLYLDDASLSEIQFDVVYDYVLVRHICNFPMYICVTYVCVCLNIWTTCWIICGVVILKTYMFLCFFLSYMMCFIIFHLCFQLYMYKVSTIWSNQWQHVVWFFFIFSDFFGHCKQNCRNRFCSKPVQ
jgi:hypothetical protein